MGDIDRDCYFTKKSVSILLLFNFWVLVVAEHKPRTQEILLRLKESCKPLFMDVDRYDTVSVLSHNRSLSLEPSAPAGTSCTANFRTRLQDHGLCIHMPKSNFRSNYTKIEFVTGPLNPDKIVQRHRGLQHEWCTPQQFLTVRVSTAKDENNLDKDFSYEFFVKNITLNSIPVIYHLDTFAECDLEHRLNHDQKVIVLSKHNPPVTLDIPKKCSQTFISTSLEEFEQICVKIDLLDMKTGKTVSPANEGGCYEALQIDGLNKQYYSVKEAIGGTPACSDKKQLTFTLLNSNDSQTCFFRAEVSSRWHFQWENQAEEETEQTGLGVVKGITYFIATIDSLVALMAVGLNAHFKRQRGPWSNYADNFAAHTPSHSQSYQQAEGAPPQNYQHGSYPELPGQAPAPTQEVHAEAHTY